MKNRIPNTADLATKSRINPVRRLFPTLCLLGSVVCIGAFTSCASSVSATHRPATSVAADAPAAQRDDFPQTVLIDAAVSAQLQNALASRED